MTTLQPSMLTVLEEDYQLTHSEIYTGNILGELAIEGYQFCMGLKRAFESLISDGYGSFILTVGCIPVGISYCADNAHYKVFNSHARDMYGKSHPQGTCALY